MKDEPVMNPDPEQQRRDNAESRRQSGLEPRPQDREPGEAKSGDEEEHRQKRDG